MGYTHYWYAKKNTPDELLVEAGRDCARIIEAANIPLAGPHGEPGTKPVVDLATGKCWFNGLGDDAHETFCWPPDLTQDRPWGEPGEVFTFCKTAQKQYDTVVVACLLRIEKVLGDYINVSSDASDLWEFAGIEVSDGWQQVNATLGHPTTPQNEESAFALYERVFGETPPIPRAFAEDANVTKEEV